MSLAETQRRLWRLVTGPDGVAQALRAEAEASSTRPASPLATLVRGDSRADSIARLDVYANAYFYRVHSVLEKDYPALAAALGADAFNDVVTSYLLVNPPSHPSLRHAGARLADFLARHAAGEGVRGRAPWAADLARFEWAMVDAFDAPNSQALSRDSVAVLAPERFVELPLALRKEAFFVKLDWQVDGVRRSLDDDEPLYLPGERTSSGALVWRVAERVRHRPVEPVEASVLPLVAGGTTFGNLCAQLAKIGDESTTPQIAAELLERWLADRLLIEPSPSRSS